MPEAPPAVEPAAAGSLAARECALRLLARREHSVVELQRKLIQRGFDDATVGALCTELQTADLLSDRRFCELYVRDRVERGFGPLKILAELERRGVSRELARAELSGYDDQWPEALALLALKRYGLDSNTPPPAPADRERQSRFFRQRGFDPRQIAALFSRR